MLKQDKVVELKQGDLFYFDLCTYDDRHECECYIFLEYETPTSMKFFSQKDGKFATWDITLVYKALASSTKYLKVYQDGEDITEYLLSELKRQKALWRHKANSIWL